MAARGFSLIELVVVVVIVGVIAAIAVPRLSRGSEGAGESAMIATLAVMNKAVDLYAAEHNGQFPTTALQLFRYTDEEGNVSTTLQPPFLLGPYLRSGPPVLQYGPHRGQRRIHTAPDHDVAWIYNPAIGQFSANLAPVVPPMGVAPTH